MTEPNFYPVSLFRLSGEDDTRENQAERAITWLCKQSGGDITVIITKRFEDKAMECLVQSVNAKHYTWRENDGQYLTGRALYAWPNHEGLRNLWHSQLDAVVVIERG